MTAPPRILLMPSLSPKKPIPETTPVRVMRY